MGLHGKNTESVINLNSDELTLFDFSEKSDNFEARVERVIFGILNRERSLERS